QVGGRYYIAMEYLDGQTLGSIIEQAQKKGGMARALYLKILSDTLAGLHYAHELNDWDSKPLGVVHRDASPANIFVTYDGTTKLVDFGIAKAATSATQTEAGKIKGKTGYSAPEHLQGAPLDRRADIFTMGVVLWEIIAERRMWPGLSDAEIREKIV